MRFLTCLTLSLGAIGLSATPHAQASTFDFFGASPRSMALGGAMTAAAAGSAALFYNPAALLGSEEVQLSAGFIWTTPDLYVDRGDPASDRETVLPSDHAGLTLGWVYTFSGVLENRLAVGVGLYLPTEAVASVQALDPSTPHFYMYQTPPQKIMLLVGVAGEPAEWLSLGLAAQILVDVFGATSLNLDVLNGRFSKAEMQAEITPTATAIAGLRVRPYPGLSIGLSFRGSSRLTVALPVRVTEGDAYLLDIQLSQVLHWTPHQFSLGLSWEMADPAIGLHLDATYGMWSEAPDPSPQVYADQGGKLIDGLGLGRTLDLSAGTMPLPLGFVDTVNIRAGVAWSPVAWLELRGGYGFRPTPAPRATSVSAFLDGDAHVASLGAGLNIGRLLALDPATTTVDVGSQFTVLPRRTTLREGALDPIGGLSHGGFLFSLSVSVQHSY